MNRPPVGIASSAFTTRFVNTSRSSSAMPATGGSGTSSTPTS